MIKALAIEQPRHLVAGSKNPGVFWRGSRILFHQKRIYQLGRGLQGTPVETLDMLATLWEGSSVKCFLTIHGHLVPVVSVFDVRTLCQRSQECCLDQDYQCMQKRRLRWKWYPTQFRPVFCARFRPMLPDDGDRVRLCWKTPANGRL